MDTDSEPVPIYIRIGPDGTEHQIGALAREIGVQEQAVVAALAGLFRAAAWALENSNWAEMLDILGSGDVEVEVAVEMEADHG